MYITKVINRNRNDFSFEAYCRNCQQTSRWPDGYADAYYQEQVIPNRKCPTCELSERQIEASISAEAAP